MSRRTLQGKYGTCDRYRSPKTKYWKQSVAKFDLGVLAAKFPGESFALFRCRYCRHWHIGKPTESAAAR